jgi:hypothetical protein
MECPLLGFSLTLYDAKAVPTWINSGYELDYVLKTVR